MMYAISSAMPTKLPRFTYNKNHEERKCFSTNLCSMLPIAVRRKRKTTNYIPVGVIFNNNLCIL